jgi:hypothetical protein
MIFNLASTSPISFELVRVGDKLSVIAKPPNKYEYRGSLGEASTMYLICKGKSKIGIIPPILIDQFLKISTKKRWAIVKSIDSKGKLITVELKE